MFVVFLHRAPVAQWIECLASDQEVPGSSPGGRDITMPSDAVLNIQNLRKEYKNVTAVDGISFSVKRGEIVGLLGPNGAGKTTTISMILGLLEPTSGSVTIFGKDLAAHRGEVLRRMNFAAVYAQLPGNLTIRDNLVVFGRLYGIRNRAEKIRGLVQRFGLEALEHTRSGKLSSGEQTRLNLAKAFLNDPEFLILDEPTASLDPSSSELVREELQKYMQAHNAAILWTSHDMLEVERMCSRVLFISHGKILLEGDPKTLPQQYGKRDLEELFIAVAREPLTLT